MLSDKDLDFQVENFTRYFKKFNPHQDLKEIFSFWSGSKAFNEDDERMIWEIIKGR